MLTSSLRGEGAHAQESRHSGERDANLLRNHQGRQDHDGGTARGSEGCQRGPYLLLAGRVRPAADTLGTDNRPRGIHAPPGLFERSGNGDRVTRIQRLRNEVPHPSAGPRRSSPRSRPRPAGANGQGEPAHEQAHGQGRGRHRGVQGHRRRHRQAPGRRRRGGRRQLRLQQGGRRPRRRRDHRQGRQGRRRAGRTSRSRPTSSACSPRRRRRSAGSTSWSTTPASTSSPRSKT